MPWKYYESARGLARQVGVGAEGWIMVKMRRNSADCPPFVMPESEWNKLPLFEDPVEEF